MPILVTGGAGYIGNHVVYELLSAGYEVVVIDNLTTGHSKSILGVAYHIGDIKDIPFIRSVFRKHKIETVIHLAADALISESIKNPLQYYNNNLSGGINLLRCMVESKIPNIIFASSSTIYGEVTENPISESYTPSPLNPYGDTKLSFEKLLEASRIAYGIQYAIFRFFNVAGAHPKGHIGEDHANETHIIPNIIHAALNEKVFHIYGNNYPTKDGTCVRDYIHVVDIAKAHIYALKALKEGHNSFTCNLGSGVGHSILDVISEVCTVSCKRILSDRKSNRSGDPSSLIADCTKAKDILGFVPSLSDLKTIVSTALNWHSTHPKGY